MTRRSTTVAGGSSGITYEKLLTAIHQLVEELEERAREAEIAPADARK